MPDPRASPRVLCDSMALVLHTIRHVVVQDRHDFRPRRTPLLAGAAIDASGRLWLLQARPMTALPEPSLFTAPGPGLWMRNFRLGEWLPEAVTPLFGTWLLPELEAGYLDGMYSCIGVRVPFRWALVHDWYYTATPIPSPRLLARVITRGRIRAIKTLWHALIRVGRGPVVADRAVLSDLYRRWRDEQLPRYRKVVAQAQSELPAASPVRVTQLVTAIVREAGQYMWFLAIVGGSAWKIEASLARFCRDHLVDTIDRAGGIQVLPVRHRLRRLRAGPVRLASPAAAAARLADPARDRHGRLLCRLVDRLLRRQRPVPAHLGPAAAPSYWLLPSLVGVPLIWWALRRFHARHRVPEPRRSGRV